MRDAASVFAYAIDNFESMKDKVYNVGLQDANLTKLELCAKIKEHISFTYFESPVGEDIDKRDYIIDNSRILATGWKPKYSLDDGIRELIQGYEMIREPLHCNAR